MIGLDKNVFVLLACLALWAECEEEDEFIESVDHLELFRLGTVSSIPVVPRPSPLGKPTKFHRPTTTRRPFRKRPTTTARPPASEVELPAAPPPDFQPLPEEPTIVAPQLPQLPPEELPSVLQPAAPLPEVVQPSKPASFQPQPIEPQPPTVFESQPPFDNSPYSPPNPPPAPPAISTTNTAILPAPPGRPQRPLPPSKPNRPYNKPNIQPTPRPPAEITISEEEPALIYSESSMNGDGSYYFDFLVSNSIFRREQGFMKKSLAWPDRLIHVKTGAYSFTSPEGTVHRIDFVADENGYRAYRS